MPGCSYEVVVHSDAPPERVFAILSDAEHWSEWAGPMIGHSSFERQGAPEPGGVGAIRKLGRWPVYGREEVVASVAPSHHAYVLLSGQPVRNYRADVTLTPDGSGTRIHWEANFDPVIPGTAKLMTAMYRHFITQTATRLAKTAADA